MELRNKSILIISPESWDHLPVSKHHYARFLARRGNQVFFLNPPGKRTAIRKTKFEKVWEVDYPKFPAGFRFFPGPIRSFLSRKKLKSLKELCDAEFDIIWSFDNSVFFDLDKLEVKLTISHIVDLNQDFQTARAARSADLCLGCTSFIVNRLKAYNKRTFFINHGFNQPDGSIKELPLSGNKIRAGYAGNLDIPYIDWELVQELIRANPEVEFHFAGKLTQAKNKEMLNAFDNVIFHGILEPERLQAFYAEMDVLLITYLAAQYPEQLANPHKVMEYLASGRTILATFTAEYVARKELLVMAGSRKEYLEMFSEITANLDSFNSTNRMMARKEFALDNSYDRQIDRIEELIKPELA